MRFHGFVLVLAIALPAFATPVGAQAVSDLRLDRVAVEGHGPFVNATAWIVGTVFNEGPGDTIVEIDVRYADGTPIAPPGVGPYTRFARAQTATTFNVSFHPTFDRRGPATVVVNVATRTPDPAPDNNRGELALFIHAPRLAATFALPTGRGVLPEGTGFLRLHVENLGNAPDRPTLEASAAGPWNVTIPPVPLIGPGENASLLVLVRNLPGGDPAPLSLTVTATSSVRTSTTARTTAPAIVVNASLVTARHEARWEVRTDDLHVLPGEKQVIRSGLVNAGETDLLLRIDSKLAVGSALWPVSLVDPRPQALVALAPGESRVVALEVHRPEGAPGTAADVDLLAGSLDWRILRNAPGQGFNASARVRAVAAGPDLSVEDVRTPETVYVGDAPRLVARVVNRGRLASEPGSLEFAVRDAVSIHAETNIELPAIASGAMVNLSWTPRPIEVPGEYAATARLFDIREDRRSDNDARSAPFRAARAEITMLAPPAVEVAPGATLFLAGGAGGLSAENRGDLDETIHVNARSSATWLNASWTVKVPGNGGRTALPWSIRVPDRPGILEAQVELDARLESRPEFKTVRSLLVRVVDLEPPRLRFAAPKPPVLGDDPVAIALTVEDATGVAFVEGFVIDPQGARSVLAFTRSADPDLFAAAFAPERIGRHAIVVKAVDASIGAHAANATIELVVEAAPFLGLEGVDFETGTVTSNARLAFRPLDAGRLAHVEADVGTGFVALPFPYVVDLTGPDGPRSVQLRAVSEAGTVWTGTWNVTLDRTPPSFEEAKVELRPDGRVDVRAKVSGATAVTARFLGATAPVEIALERRGEERFEVAATPPAMWREIVFTAVDPAGNLASKSVVGPDGDRVPAVPLAMALAAALLVARSRPRKGP